MKVWKTLIVDDEPAARRRLQSLLKDEAQIEIIDEADDGQIAVEKIKTLQPELVFMDIEMPEKNGVEVALETLSLNYQLIFLTAYDEYAVKAFETRALDYLLKPVTLERLRKSLARLEDHTPAQTPETIETLLKHLYPDSSSQIGVRHGAMTYIVNGNHIAYIEAEDGYSRIHLTPEGKAMHRLPDLSCDSSLDQLLKRLPSKEFMRVHRSIVVRIQQVRSYHQEGRTIHLFLKDFPDLKLPVSRANGVMVKQVWGVL